MKGFVKRVTACIFALAMLVSVFGTLGAGAATVTPVEVPELVQQGPKPLVTDWTVRGEQYPKTASLGLYYLGGDVYEGVTSLTALYDAENKLIGIGIGTISGSKTSYNVTISAEGAASVKCFIWSDTADTLKPKAYVSDKTYAEFTSEIVPTLPDFNVTAGLGIRNSFEAGRFQIFQNNGTYNVELTEETAYTGKKSAKISGRGTVENSSLRTKLAAGDYAGGTSLTASAWMKKPETVTEDAEFYISVLSAGGKTTNQISTPIQITDNDWHKVEFSVDSDFLTKSTDGAVVQLGARTGTAGSYTYIDYYADDFSVVCPDATNKVVFDDTKTNGLKWDFETGATGDWVTQERKMMSIAAANKWSRTLNAQELSVVNTADAEFWNTVTTKDVPKELQIGARTTPPDFSNKMLEVKATQDDYSNSHVSAKIKLSKLDLIPGRTYQMTFWAFCNTKSRGLYTGIVSHSKNEDNSKEFYGDSAQTTPDGTTTVAANQLAGGIINYSDTEAEYKKNYAAQIQRFWRRYSVTITPADSDFNDEGDCDLCFVMTEDRPSANDWYFKSIYIGEKLYLDDIEITDITPGEGEVTALLNDGMYTKRATFENDTMTMFSPQARASVALTDADSNTGDYCAEYTNRKDNWSSLGASIKGAAPSSKVTASCFLKKAEPGQPKCCIG